MEYYTRTRSHGKQSRWIESSVNSFWCRLLQTTKAASAEFPGNFRRCHSTATAVRSVLEFQVQRNFQKLVFWRQRKCMPARFWICLTKVHLRYLCSTTSLTYARLGLKLYQDKYMHSSTNSMFACSYPAYKPWLISQRTIFFSHTKPANGTFSHGL